MLALLIPLAPFISPVMLAVLTTLVLVLVGTWETIAVPRTD
ncbi:MAG: hypothetical protein R3175_03405 [Marinobacter sp.]|nr:hypothetical protein [Marinobacter sp.]MDX1755085.1 hypothetical protein [Marinobacter sp.]